jgi:DNA polymerase-3 subunit gamma/tau
VIALVRARRDISLLLEIEAGLRLVKYTPGRIEFEPSAAAAPDLAPRLAQRLQAWTGARWGVTVVGAGGGATIAEARAAEQDALRLRAEAHPLLRAAMAAFPGATIRDIRLVAPAEPGLPPAEVEPAYDDAWDPLDPFDEE